MRAQGPRLCINHLFVRITPYCSAPTPPERHASSLDCPSKSPSSAPHGNAPSLHPPGTLKLDSFQTKLQNSLSPIDLAPKSPDGVIRFGELVLALGIGTSAALSVSVDQANRPHCVTGARGDLATPCGRSTFYLERYECARPSAYEPLFEGDALRYGSKFRIVVNPATRGEDADPSGGSTPTYLFSRPISSDFAAKHSKHQYVGLTGTKNYDTVWQVLAVDPAQRGLSEGLEVTVGAPVVLVHCATNQVTTEEHPPCFASVPSLVGIGTL